MFWENYHDGELLIARSIWNGITTDPNNQKSKVSGHVAFPLIQGGLSFRLFVIDWPGRRHMLGRYGIASNRCT
jgi:hypothetical protein